MQESQERKFFSEIDLLTHYVIHGLQTIANILQLIYKLFLIYTYHVNAHSPYFPRILSPIQVLKQFAKNLALPGLLVAPITKTCFLVSRPSISVNS